MAIDPQSPSLTIGIVGAGVMGRGIAQVAAEAGITVLLADARRGAGEEARDFCAGLIRRKVDKGQLTAAEADATIARIQPTNAGPESGYGPFAPCDLVVEAVAERIDIKTALLKDLEAVVRDDCIIATNTSSLSVTAFAAAARLPGRVAGFHFFNPAPLMKIVEVIGGVLTDESVVETLLAIGQRMGHFAVRASDTPGFIVNHAGRGYTTEALRIVQEGIAGFADIDRIMTETVGFRMGPFELLDLTGLDVSHPAMEAIYRQYYEEPRYRPVVITAQRQTGGLLGRKTGRGFYAYPDGKIERPAEPVAPTAPEGATIWISQRYPRAAVLLQEALAAVGATLEAGERPSADAVILLTPLGEDCTTAALAEGVDPARAVAVDCLFGLEKRRTLMRNPAARPEIATAAHGLLAAGGHAVTVINDSPGFVAQRIAAGIVNIGTDMAQQRVAQPEDIDRAVELGLGYPKGPLKLGNAIGPERVLAVLEAMYGFYGDPRYRPSPWLKRRARLGLDLYARD
ncbi:MULTISPECIES: 3-hydroxyacyl-CoA dehydrogenase [unclassified Chelatococcus]|uniref:3-hydroxyacyl-CoA dehydrogenase n=1 Tax=unclassified Chelatococcus TaxID=2638111 RepID=UPI001BCCFFE7|nr:MULTISPECIES: 3-hydroxyacyl-CoA dehydrogenase [unclassified Chelatococcus]MBS7697626.1 3-hydroxyacyl-CoA dehydrogenase [Chelatococcus sp. YT9]MBX3559000.1 3-hydroxyacyl-CoA dehydrogenase [Chelatococcus sp.]